MFYIGIMTGNSMDAVDLAYVQTDGEKNLELLAFHSYPFSRQMQEDVALLRQELKRCLTRFDVEKLPVFQKVHDAFIQTVASCAVDFIKRENILSNGLNGICFHGKTLDHCPPSRKLDVVMGRQTPYTVQLGSGQMLADEIYHQLRDKNVSAVRVIYDFRSDDIFSGGEGAPLIPVLNAFLARQKGILNRIDINAGNTSNLCLIREGEALGGWDLGPCNEYPDYLVRTYAGLPFDKDGLLAKEGCVDFDLLRCLFQTGQDFYNKKPPKSGDPAIYGTQQIRPFQTGEDLSVKIRTSLYFAAYLMVYGLQFIDFKMPCHFLLFGGGWKNPFLYGSFVDLLTNKAFVLPEHKTVFESIINRFDYLPQFEIDQNAQAIESMLMALMGAYYDLHKPWTTLQLTGCDKPCVLGVEAISGPLKSAYTDKLCRASF